MNYTGARLAREWNYSFGSNKTFPSVEDSSVRNVTFDELVLAYDKQGVGGYDGWWPGGYFDCWTNFWCNMKSICDWRTVGCSSGYLSVCFRHPDWFEWPCIERADHGKILCFNSSRKIEVTIYMYILYTILLCISILIQFSTFFFNLIWFEED